MFSTSMLMFAAMVHGPAAGQLPNMLRPSHQLSDHHVTNSIYNRSCY